MVFKNHIGSKWNYQVNREPCEARHIDVLITHAVSPASLCVCRLYYRSNISPDSNTVTLAQPSWHILLATVVPTEMRHRLLSRTSLLATPQQLGQPRPTALRTPAANSTLQVCISIAPDTVIPLLVDSSAKTQLEYAGGNNFYAYAPVSIQSQRVLGVLE